MAAYDFVHRSATPGLLVGGAANLKGSYLNGDSVSIPTGCAVVQGSSDDKAKLPSASTDKVLGVVVYSDNFALNVDVDSTGLKTGTQMSVLRRGIIWVTVEEAVSAGDRAFMRFSAGTGATASAQIGGFRKSADTNTSAVELLGAQYLTSAAAGGLAQLAIDALTDRSRNS